MIDYPLNNIHTATQLPIEQPQNLAMVQPLEDEVDGDISLTQTRLNINQLRNVDHDKPVKHPQVSELNRIQCLSAIRSLKEGPANIPKVLQDFEKTGEKYTDEDFSGVDMLFTPETPQEAKDYYLRRFNDGKYDFHFARLSDKFNNSVDVFNQNGQPSWLEPRQGGAGTCYIISAMAAVGEFPQIIKDAFLTQETNDAGIYGIRFFIRGKPWVVTIDDEFLFFLPNSPQPRLVFT